MDWWIGCGWFGVGEAPNHPFRLVGGDCEGVGGAQGVAGAVAEADGVGAGWDGV